MAEVARTCCHCHRRKAVRSRGLCGICYTDLEIRNSYQTIYPREPKLRGPSAPGTGDYAVCHQSAERIETTIHWYETESMAREAASQLNEALGPPIHSPFEFYYVLASNFRYEVGMRLTELLVALDEVGKSSCPMRVDRTFRKTTAGWHVDHKKPRGKRA